jgi:predicted membrane protein
MAENSSFNVTSVLNDVRRKFDQVDFERGSVTSILGSADMDLRDVKMKGTEAVLALTNVLGSTYIYPALDWNVILDITEIAGTVKDKRDEIPAKPKKTLKITGVTVLGDVYIR